MPLLLFTDTDYLRSKMVMLRPRLLSLLRPGPPGSRAGYQRNNHAPPSEDTRHERSEALDDPSPVYCLFDFSPSSPDELELRAGDIVTVVGPQNADGWVLVRWHSVQDVHLLRGDCWQSLTAVLRRLVVGYVFCIDAGPAPPIFAPRHNTVTGVWVCARSLQ